MMFTIIIVLIVSLVLIGVIVNAMQQHKNRIETERRAEASKQKAIIENTEVALKAAEGIPFTQRLLFIMKRRILIATKALQNTTDDPNRYNQQIKGVEEELKAIDIAQPPPPEEKFKLPQADKQVIQLIKGIKTLRALLRAEFKKGRLESRVFLSEDKLLERLQLRANVDTLIRRGDIALKKEQIGSARQCLEKAIGALSSQPVQDEYIMARKRQLQDKLSDIENNLKQANSEDVAQRQESERNELDELFAEKKKW
ncbi:hypothetical protein [Paraglaciecola sp. 2405UD69-4]|uniref:hypothetical protein n=1 Tax=Paraglaciecola sp. 2405UD69-4 TaxID=3391836 RepID=UPI0039C9179E